MPTRAAVFHTAGWRPAEDRRPCASRRGYDREWQALAKRVLAAQPWCVLCRERGVQRRATCVDHIKPFNGIDDRLRLDPANTQGLCTACNVAKGYRDRRAGHRLLSPTPSRKSYRNQSQETARDRADILHSF